MPVYKVIIQEKKNEEKQNLFITMNYIEDFSYYISTVCDHINPPKTFYNQYLEELANEVRTYLAANFINLEWIGEIELNDDERNMLDFLRN